MRKPFTYSYAGTQVDILKSNEFKLAPTQMKGELFKKFKLKTSQTSPNCLKMNLKSYRLLHDGKVSLEVIKANPDYSLSDCE